MDGVGVLLVSVVGFDFKTGTTLLSLVLESPGVTTTNPIPDTSTWPEKASCVSNRPNVLQYCNVYLSTQDPAGLPTWR